jgi:hypothetical protein
MVDNQPSERTAAAVYFACGRACAAVAAQQHDVMRRKIFNLVAVSCLAICLATAVLWLRSYAAADAVGYARRYGAGEVSFVNGRLHIWRWATTDPSLAGKTWWPGWRYSAPAPTNSWAYRIPGHIVTSSFSFAGMNYLRHSFPPGGAPPAAAGDTVWYFHAPAWMIQLATAALPAWWVYRRRRERVARARALGLCPACGYDLRASPGRCPECGAAAAPAGTAE